MLKNLTSGAIINYGSTLPDASTAFDGALFFKTSSPGQGLYVFNFVQDFNPTSFGDQVGQGWTITIQGELFVQKAGDLMSGDLTIQSGGTIKGLRVLNAAGNGGGRFFSNDGANAGATLSGEAGPINFVAGNASRMTLTTAGDVILTTAAGQGKVWTNLNDGSGSGMDADLLDGLDSSYLLNSSNQNAGTLSLDRFPFVPVQQGGGPSQGTNKINIGWGGTGNQQLLVSVDGSSFGSTWPISIAGNATTANSAQTAAYATNAGHATEADNALFIRHTGSPAGQAMKFSFSGQGGQPNWVWGGNDGVNMFVYNPSGFSVNYANSADRANSAGYADVAGSVSGGSGTVRAWAVIEGNFYGVLNGYNISSVTGGANGDPYATLSGGFQVNFASPMPSADYATVALGPAGSSNNGSGGDGETPTTPAYTVMNTLKQAGANRSNRTQWYTNVGYYTNYTATGNYWAEFSVAVFA